MAEGPHTLLAEVFAVFSQHTRQHWEPEYASYLFWKFKSVSAYRDEDISGILQRAYIDYKRDRGLGRIISDRDITYEERSYIHHRLCEKKGIRPKQRRAPKPPRRSAQRR